MATWPARWKMACGLASRTSCSISAASRVSPSMKVTVPSVRSQARFSRVPWRERLSKSVTSVPSSSSRAARLLPTKPQPPVTRARSMV